jgi:hypothetical protein
MDSVILSSSLRRLAGEQRIIVFVPISVKFG